MTRGLIALVVVLGIGPATTGGPAAAAGHDPRDARISVVGATGSGAGVATQATARSVRCAEAARAAGWTGENLVISVAVALAESQCVAGAQGNNGPTSGCPNGSLDRGAWQINNCYHSWVTDACAYDVSCNARAAHDIWGWSGWSAWATYTNGSYRNYLTEARDGVAEAGGGVHGTVNTGGDPLNVRSGPGTSYALVGTVAHGTTVRIICQSRGTRVWSDVYQYWTDIWDKISDGGFVSDGFVHTGSSGTVAPGC
ncbi:SH3 domain-containing protein [Micromonospora sp. NBC_01655]|uniref:SH3 domain-containing protein n=1 Tax=Micromonospora sp. NBC_01655 TaxID=2975983 RepID=UPI0022588212|nr:SH3 domain-containing protein [Micromonospora sp. NBC_01655]MCX4471679.1 SH3 domain-containing protein [Micromonospora sp. NBC_01655]